MNGTDTSTPKKKPLLLKSRVGRTNYNAGKRKIALKKTVSAASR